MGRWYVTRHLQQLHTNDVDITAIYESIRRHLALIKLWAGGTKRGEFQKAWQKVAKSKVPETNGTSDAAALHVASGLRQCPRLKLAVILELVTDPSTLMLLVYLATPTEKVEPGIGKSIMLKGPFAKLLVCEQWRE